MPSQEGPKKHLTVTTGRVWLEPAELVRVYAVTLVALGFSEEREPFRVWVRSGKYPLDFDAPERTRVFQMTRPPGHARARLTLTARQADKITSSPSRFLDFCLMLLDPAHGDDPGYHFSTQCAVTWKAECERYSIHPIAMLFGDPRWDAPREGRVLRFAHMRKPYTLIRDRHRFVAENCMSAVEFEDILRDHYNWPAM